jgi:hypothetical protein
MSTSLYPRTPVDAELSEAVVEYPVTPITISAGVIAPTEPVANRLVNLTAISGIVPILPWLAVIL